MSVPKKSLINNRAAVKKAIIASAPGEATDSKDAGSLQASGLTALSLKAKRNSAWTLKAKRSALFSLKAKKYRSLAGKKR